MPCCPKGCWLTIIGIVLLYDSNTILYPRGDSFSNIYFFLPSCRIRTECCFVLFTSTRFPYVCSCVCSTPSHPARHINAYPGNRYSSILQLQLTALLLQYQYYLLCCKRHHPVGRTVESCCTRTEIRHTYLHLCSRLVPDPAATVSHSVTGGVVRHILAPYRQYTTALHNQGSAAATYSLALSVR